MNVSNKRRIHDKAGGPATLISEGCKVAGVISGDGDFLLSGEVEGECDLSGSLTIATNGSWKGSITASTVIVAGTAPVIGSVCKIVERPDLSLSPSVRSLRATSRAVLVRSSRSFAKHSPTMNSSSIGTPARIDVRGATSSWTIS